MSKKGQPYVGCRGRLLSQIKGSAKETVSKLSVRFTTGGGWRNSSAYTAGPVDAPVSDSDAHPWPGQRENTPMDVLCKLVSWVYWLTTSNSIHPCNRDSSQPSLFSVAPAGGVEMNSQISPPSTAQANKSSPMRAPRAAAQGLCPAVRTQRIATHCD
ncbi:hypothetical protein PGT21_000759, partial [Puccinia graminis f. sp. tritici]